MLHLHAGGSLSSGAVRFAVLFREPDRYRFFLDFQTGETVHTAAYTVDVT